MPQAINKDFVKNMCLCAFPELHETIAASAQPSEARCLSFFIISLLISFSLQDPDLYHKYGKMWYKNSHSVGIRRKFGDKKQVVSFGGRKCSKTQEQLTQLAVECVQKLNGGMTEADVNTWAKGQAK